MMNVIRQILIGIAIGIVVAILMDIRSSRVAKLIVREMVYYECLKEPPAFNEINREEAP